MAVVPTLNPSAKPLVFAIDDEPDNLDLIVRTIGPICQVRRFLNGREAITAARAERPMVVLVDFRLPDMNGGDILRALKRDNIGCAALLVTGFADLDEVSRIRQEKLAFRIISKPWAPADLRSQVQLAISLSKLDQTVATLRDSTRSSASG